MASKIFFTTLLLLGGIVPAFAMETETLWTTGKIYVVFAVLLIILILIFVLLFILERKISRLEKQIL